MLMNSHQNNISFESNKVKAPRASAEIYPFIYAAELMRLMTTPLPGVKVADDILLSTRLLDYLLEFLIHEIGHLRRHLRRFGSFFAC
jgi:hypothetical protein